MSRISCYSLQVSGAPDQIGNDEVPIPRLLVTLPLSLLPTLLLPCLLTVMMKFLFHVPHVVLLCFRVMVMLNFSLPRPSISAFPPPPPLLFFALNLLCKLAAAADALSGYG
jgi:hypothetical protein